MQAALGIAQAGRRVLYVSGEESVAQVRSRSLRLGKAEDLLFLQAETDLLRALKGAEQIEPDVLIVDSVQTTFVPELGGTPGGVSQVREVAARLVLYAKATGRSVLLVGHVTKGGQLAGPRTLEHAVDTVIYFEGDANPPFRVLRAEKNRFGATGELALFEMTGEGLQEVSEPSAALIADRPSDRAGTVVTSSLEGSRTLLLEIQALVAPGFPGSTRRTSLGIDGGRLAMLVAVLGKADYALHDKDVFVNVVGGVRIHEPAADLAVAAAITSSLFNRVVGSEWLILGEVGLTGELRSVPRLEQRLQEGARHGQEGYESTEGVEDRQEEAQEGEDHRRPEEGYESTDGVEDRKEEACEGADHWRPEEDYESTDGVEDRSGQGQVAPSPRVPWQQGENHERPQEDRPD